MAVAVWSGTTDADVADSEDCNKVTTVEGARGMDRLTATTMLVGGLHSLVTPMLFTDCSYNEKTLPSKPF